MAKMTFNHGEESNTSQTPPSTWGMPTVSDQSSNPYSYAPSSTSHASRDSRVLIDARPESRRLATSSERLLAHVYDVIIYGVIFIVCTALCGFAAVGYGMSIGAMDPNSDPSTQQTFAIVMVGAIFGAFAFSWIATTALHIYYLYFYSQSIGKRLVRLVIIDFESGQRASFTSCFILRSLINSLIISMIPVVGLIYAMVDVCFIFSENRRCVHDLLAGTTVIKLDDQFSNFHSP